MANTKIENSIISQLENISNNLQSIIFYEMDTCGKDVQDAIDYENIKDKVDAKIKDIKDRAENQC